MAMICIGLVSNQQIRYVFCLKVICEQATAAVKWSFDHQLEEFVMAVIESIKDKASVVMSSAGEINKLAIDKMEEMAKINLASAGYFSEIGIKQMRALSGVKDLETMRKFTADSISLSGEIAKKLLDDSKTWMGFGSDIKEKVTDLFKKEEEPKKKAVKAA